MVRSSPGPIRTARVRAEPAHQCLALAGAYQELLPYYEQAETLLGVHRFEPEPDLRAIVGKLARNGAGWSARPLTLAWIPASSVFPRSRALRRFRLGQEPEGRRPACSAGAGQHLPNLTILTGQAVRDFVADPDRPERLIGVRTEEGSEFRAGVVLLAAGALHSPRLLQGYLADSGLAERLLCAGCGGAQLQIPPAQRCAGVFRDPKDRSAAKTLLLLNERLPRQHPALEFDGELLGTLIPGFVPRGFARALSHRRFLLADRGRFRSRQLRRRQAQWQARSILSSTTTRRAYRQHGRNIAGWCVTSIARCGKSAYRRRPRRFRWLAPHARLRHLVAGSDPRTSVVDADGKGYGLDKSVCGGRQRPAALPARSILVDHLRLGVAGGGTAATRGAVGMNGALPAVSDIVSVSKGG